VLGAAPLSRIRLLVDCSAAGFRRGIRGRVRGSSERIELLVPVESVAGDAGEFVRRGRGRARGRAVAASRGSVGPGARIFSCRRFRPRRRPSALGRPGVPWGSVGRASRVPLPARQRRADGAWF